MDTKRNTSEEFKQEAALKAKALIESSNPDVVIVSDDNAVKCLVQPYNYKSNIFVNTSLQKKLNIDLPPSIVKRATIVE